LAAEQQHGGEVAGHVTAGPALQAELVGPLVALPSIVDSLVKLAGQLQHVTQVGIGAHDRLGVADLLGDPAGLPVQSSGPVQFAEVV
jgi:hypothetical protein